LVINMQMLMSSTSFLNFLIASSRARFFSIVSIYNIRQKHHATYPVVDVVNNSSNYCTLRPDNKPILIEC
jgi:hypothetical protein